MPANDVPAAGDSVWISVPAASKYVTVEPRSPFNTQIPASGTARGVVVPGTTNLNSTKPPDALMLSATAREPDTGMTLKVPE